MSNNLILNKMIRPRNNSEKANLVRNMANELKTRFDCISKLDAVKWLKDLYPASSLTLRVNAYMLAYED